MSKKNRSVSDEDLKNVRGGIIYELRNHHPNPLHTDPLYVVINDKYEVIDAAEDINDAYDIANRKGIKDQRIISWKSLKDYIREQFSLAMLKKFRQEKDD